MPSSTRWTCTRSIISDEITLKVRTRVSGKKQTDLSCDCVTQGLLKYVRHSLFTASVLLKSIDVKENKEKNTNVI